MSPQASGPTPAALLVAVVVLVAAALASCSSGVDTAEYEATVDGICAERHDLEAEFRADMSTLQEDTTAAVVRLQEWMLNDGLLIDRLLGLDVPDELAQTKSELEVLLEERERVAATDTAETTQEEWERIEAERAALSAEIHALMAALWPGCPQL